MTSAHGGMNNEAHDMIQHRGVAMEPQEPTTEFRIPTSACSPCTITDPRTQYSATSAGKVAGPRHEWDRSSALKTPRAERDAAAADGEDLGVCSCFCASPRMVRLGVLVLVSLLPFGAHFVKNSLSSLQVYLLTSPSLHFNAIKYGSIMSAQSLPNVLMPFFGGIILDSKNSRVGLRTFLAVTVAGHITFALAVGAASYPAALAGAVVYGAGSGTLVVAQRSAISK
ncbi:hypothetical protein JKP88DRAFT_268504, partial [Tribonema minus]